MPHTLEILADLVQMPTVSRTPNDRLIDYAAAILAEAGFMLSFTDAGSGRRNLFASIGPTRDDGILLSGHSDVVPVEGQCWSSDPFVLTERHGRLHGRGTADMKGFIACVLRAATTMRGRSPRRPLHIALSCDEEIGCVGVRPMLAKLCERRLRVALCVVGEPTSLGLCVSHKGKTALLATCLGRAAHSALAPQGLNAISLASAFVLAIEEEQIRLARTRSLQHLFDLPHSTVHVGTIAGGTALNVVPARCTLALEVRTMPQDQPAAIVKRLRERADAIAVRSGDPDAAIEIEEVGGYPALLTPVDALGPAAHVLSEAGPTGLSFGTEAGLFRNALDCPTVVWGPGSMAQGHTADEFIEIGELDRCDAKLDRLLAQLFDP